MATYLGADFERQLWTWLLSEQLAQRGFRSDEGWKLFYYRSPKGKFLHLVIENIRKKAISALKIIPTEKTDLRDLEILRAFKHRLSNPYEKFHLLTWGPGSAGNWDPSIKNYPWEALI